MVYTIYLYLLDIICTSVIKDAGKVIHLLT